MRTGLVMSELTGRNIDPCDPKYKQSTPQCGIDADQHASSFDLKDLRTATIVLIEPRLLFRECLTRALSSAAKQIVVSFPSVEKWLEVRATTICASVIILSLSNTLQTETAKREIALLSQLAERLPVVLLSDMEDPDRIIAALDEGVRGYIPTSIPLDVAIEALRLVKAGGIFVPASSLIAARKSAEGTQSVRQAGATLFTARQAAVVDALRKGKANKIIAFELNMQESTVKVHVRNIMKKLKAKNRTEVAVMANGMMNGTH